MKKVLFLLGTLVLIISLAGCSSSTKQADSNQVTGSEAASGDVAQAKSAPEVPKEEVIKTVSIVDQVKDSAHYKLFPTMVSKGEAVKDPNGEHYGDGCIRCHSEVKIVDDPEAKLDDFFPGGKYSNNSAGITCKVCHIFEGKDMLQLRNSGWEACGICHVNSSGDPKLGSEVHHPQYQMIKGVAIGDDFPARPSYKYANMNDFSCQDCHVTNSLKHDFLVPGETIEHDKEGIKRESLSINLEKFKDVFKQGNCSTCHGNPQSTIDQVKAQQEEIGKMLEELKSTYDDWSQKIEGMDTNDPKVTAFKNGATFYTFVEADGSKGVHNYEYAKAALEKVIEYWSSLK